MYLNSSHRFSSTGRLKSDGLAFLPTRQKILKKHVRNWDQGCGFTFFLLIQIQQFFTMQIPIHLFLNGDPDPA